MGKLIEGFWDCKYCNTKGIHGGIRECPKCGKAQDKNTVFYLDKNNLSYVPEEKAIHISRNPDWLCEYCGQLNSDNDYTCISCGASKTSQNLNYFENHKKKEEENRQKLLREKQYEESNSSDYSINSSDDISTTDDNCSNEENFSIKNFFSLHMYPILITFFSLLFISGFIFLLIPKDQTITVEEMSWERSIDIERYQTVDESGWSLPVGARLHYSQEEYSHTEQVLDHYETKTRQVSKERISGYEEYVSGYRDLGNGYFEEITSSRPIYETYYETETYEEPVYRNEDIYRTKYYYEIDKWLYERSIKTNETNKNPYWGEVNLNSDERISSEREHYSILGINTKGKEQYISLSYEDWNSLEIGQTVKLKISLGYGTIVE